MNTAGRPRAAHLRTHCVHGHKYTPDTEYQSPDGIRVCRTCRKDARRRYLARLELRDPIDRPTKCCSMCGIEKPLSDFSYNRGTLDRRQYECRPCRRQRARDAQHGLAPGEYDSMLVAQDGRCAICRQQPLARGLAVDHDHTTGAIRGLLCLACNTALGSFGDDPERLIAAFTYLTRGGYT